MKNEEKRKRNVKIIEEKGVTSEEKNIRKNKTI